jgi:hypothetical protein
MTHGHHDTLIQKHITESEDEQFNMRYRDHRTTK